MLKISDFETKYVLDVFDSQFSTLSSEKYMIKLEKKFLNVFGVDCSVSHVNGTETMHSALESINIGHGNKVIVSPLTMASTSLAVLHANATAEISEVNPDTFVMDENEILKNTILLLEKIN